MTKAKTLIGGAISMNWLFETHLANFQCWKEKAKSALIAGNEDCPDSVILYAKRCPLITDVPLASYTVNENGNLRLA